MCVEHSLLKFSYLTGRYDTYSTSTQCIKYGAIVKAVAAPLSKMCFLQGQSTDRIYSPALQCYMLYETGAACITVT